MTNAHVISETVYDLACKLPPLLWVFDFEVPICAWYRLINDASV